MMVKHASWIALLILLALLSTSASSTGPLISPLASKGAASISSEHQPPCLWVDRLNLQTKQHERWCVPDMSRYEWHVRGLYEPHEGLEDYVEGGYHPVKVGDTFKEGKYVVLRRLGAGAFATVWLVEDTRGGGQWALKVMKSNYTRMARDEIDMLPNLNHPNVIRLHDNFVHSGPHGDHTVLVYQLLGTDVRPEVPGARTGLKVAQIVARGALRGLEHAHKNGITHADIKVENIIWNTDYTDVVLGDFGGAYYTKDLPVNVTVQSREYRAPEVFLRSHYNELIDIWSVACAIFEVATTHVLFIPKKDIPKMKTPRQFMLFVELLGPFPPEIAWRGTRAHKLFHPNGTLLTGHPERLYMEDLLREDHHIDDPLFADFLVSMLNYDIEKRPSASRMLQHPWLAKEISEEQEEDEDHPVEEEEQQVIKAPAVVDGDGDGGDHIASHDEL